MRHGEPFRGEGRRPAVGRCPKTLSVAQGDGTIGAVNVAAAVLVVMSAAAATGAAAQPPVPTVGERVVVTGTAAPATAGAVGRTLAVVTADDLARLPVASVTDALRLLPGVWVRHRGPFGSQTDISVRGASFGQTLVLVDGVRMNDPQTGHHSGDLPVALEDIARIELLAGAGSSLHGADAVGGVINIITRREASARRRGSAAGEHGLVQSGAAWRPADLGILTGLSASVDRSSGFAPARDFLHQQVRMDVRFGRTTMAVSFLDKDFGAAGFYGPAPSHESTDQTLVTARHQRELRSDWTLTGDAWYRTHGDEFLYDPRVLGAQPNQHRTQVLGGGARIGGRLSSSMRLTTGIEATADWLRSSALGDRDEGRVSGYTELEARLGRLLLYPSARLDSYTTFGSAFSPSLAMALPVRPRIKWRASVGRAFRVPTFTERFYTDPNHRASDALAPEHGWTADTGIDTYLGSTWAATVTGFVRREQRRDRLGEARLDGALADREHPGRAEPRRRGVRPWPARAGVARRTVHVDVGRDQSARRVVEIRGRLRAPRDRWRSRLAAAVVAVHGAAAGASAAVRTVRMDDRGCASGASDSSFHPVCRSGQPRRRAVRRNPRRRDAGTLGEGRVQCQVIAEFQNFRISPPPERSEGWRR